MVPLFLAQARVDANGGKVALDQQLVELNGTRHALDKNADLVEFQRVQQIVELAVLFAFLQLEVVLLQAVQRQLGLVIDVNLQRLRTRNEYLLLVSIGDGKAARRRTTGPMKWSYRMASISMKSFQRVALRAHSNKKKAEAYILHEFLAHGTNLLGQRRREHHALLVVRCRSENFLHIAAHVCRE